MKAYEFEYAQPRPASYDRRKVIHERRPLRIGARNYPEAAKAAKAFLAHGAVKCGRTKYHRRWISLCSLAQTTPSSLLFCPIQ